MKSCWYEASFCNQISVSAMKMIDYSIKRSSARELWRNNGVQMHVRVDDVGCRGRTRFVLIEVASALCA